MRIPCLRFLPLLTLLGLLLPSLGAAQTADQEDARLDAELDAYWAEVSRTVGAGDFDGYAALYHPDAVLVSVPQGTSYPIGNALAGWEQGFVDTREGRADAGVEFRITRRLNDATTAHDTGIFRYWLTPEGGETTTAMVHFEGLLVKKDGRWLMVMELQGDEASPAEWEAAGR